MTMELVVKINGAIEASNFDEYKENALAMLKKVNLKPKTDQEFSEAESLVKKFKQAEDAIDDARKKATENVVDIQALFADMTEVADKIRDVRLELSRKVNKEKDSRKYEIIGAGVTAVKEHIRSIVDHHKFLSSIFTCEKGDFHDAVKGKRKLETIQKAVDLEVERKIASINLMAGIYTKNHEAISSVEPAGLFPDILTLMLRTECEVHSTIDARVAKHKLEQERAEAAREEEDRKRAALEKMKNQAESKCTIVDAGGVELQGPMHGATVDHGAMVSDVLPDVPTGAINTNPNDKVDPGRFAMTIMLSGETEAVKNIALEIDSIVSKYDEVTSISLIRA